MSTPRIIVVGAGAAGLTAALRAAGGGARVTLLNAHPKVGLKILMSGGTRCNVTHRAVSERDFNGGSRHVVARILRAFTVPQTLEWFEALGVELKLEETGKYFPVTDDAQTVLDALLGACAKAGVALETGARAVRVERAEGAWRVGVQRVSDSAAFSAEVRGLDAGPPALPATEPDRWLAADAVVLATGGLSFPRTGSDGTGYALAVALGHTLVSPVPALTPFTADDRLCERVQGVTCEAELTLHVHGRRVAMTAGSLLIAHFGYSGPVALDLSRHWLRAAGEARDVTACVLPGTSREELRERWKRAVTHTPRVTVRRFLDALPERLADALAVECAVDPAMSIAQVERTRRDALLANLMARPLRVTGTLGYEKAEVTAGGVPLTEVDASTLESRVAPGLYLCGEILDVEGRLGGFNFQWAWSSGTVAGRAASA